MIDWLQGLSGLQLTLLVLAVLGASARRPGEQRGMALFLGFVASALAVYSVSNPLMDYLRRFAFPVVAATVALAAVAIDHQFHREDRMRGAAFVAFLFAIMAASASAAELSWAGVYGPNLENAHVRLGRQLAETRVPKRYQSVAIGDAGAIAYFSNWRAYDFGGLNAPIIAHGGDPTDYVLAHEPTLIVLYSVDGVTPRASQRGLDPARLTQYEPYGSVSWHASYHLLVWARKDLPPHVQSSLRDATHRAGVASRKYRSPLSMSAFAARLRTRIGF